MEYPITEITYRHSVQRQFGELWREVRPFYGRADALEFAEIEGGKGNPNVRVVHILTTTITTLIEDV